MKSESQIVKEVIVALYDNYKDDAFVIRLNSGSFKVGKRFIKTVSINGMPDILFIYKGGLFIGLEVKTEKGRLNDNQKQFQSKCKERSIPYIIVHSAKEALEEVSKVVKERGQNQNQSFPVDI